MTDEIAESIDKSLDRPAEEERGKHSEKASTNPPDARRVSRDDEDGSITIFQGAAFAGPIPHPDTLLGYKRVDPSLPDIIVRRWGAEQDHRHMQENKIVAARIQLAQRGQACGLVLGLAAIGAAVTIGIWGGPIAGPAAASAIIAIVGAVVGGTYYVKRKAMERDEPPGHDGPSEDDSDG